MQAVPYLLVAALVLVEAAAGRLFGRRLYGLRDTEVGLGLAIGWALGATLTAVLSAAALAFCHAHRLVTVPTTVLSVAVMVVLADLIYYVWHRVSHHVGWLWATHAVHHTAPRMNVLASVREGWTDVLSGTWLVWTPLALVGFSPEAITAYFTALFVWEALIHNEWTPRLGPLEWLLVTPSNHRVHHSLRAEHLNRNFGGFLIVWDRMFGTYAAEGPAPLTAFGLAGIDDDAGVIGLAFFAWRRLFLRRRASADEAGTAASI